MALSPKAQALLDLQRGKYLDSLPQKKAFIEACWRDLCVSGWSEPPLERLKTEIHRLAGSAGSYGLDRLGATALEIDRLLSADDATTEHRSEIGRHFAGLARVFEETIAG